MPRANAPSTSSRRDSPATSSASSEDDSNRRITVALKSVRPKSLLPYLQPLTRLGLVYKRGEPVQLKALASKWKRKLTSDRRSAVVQLMQFVVDVTGFDNIVVDELFEAGKKGTMRDVVHNTEDPGFYCMKPNLFEWVQVVQDLYLRFVSEAAWLDKEGQLITYNEPDSFVEFLAEMVRSDHRFMIHTGTVFALKVTTSYIRVEKQWKSDLRNESDNSELLALGGIYLEKFKKGRKYLLEIFLAARCSQDPGLAHVTVSCAEEFAVWCELKPKKFLRKKFLDVLKGFVQSGSESVRMAALKTCRSILKLDCPADCAQDLLTLLSERLFFWSGDEDVMTVKIFGDVLTAEKPWILPIHEEKMQIGSVSKSYIKANLCGGFVVNYIRSKYEIDDVHFVGYLVRLIEETMFKDYMPLLVESTIESLSHHGFSVEAVVQYLLTFERPVGNMDLVVAFVCEYIRQKVTGRAPVLREDARREGVVDVEENEKLARFLFANFPKFAKKFYDRPKYVADFVRTLGIFTQENSTLENLGKIMKKRVKKLIAIFNFSDDAQLLTAIAHTLQSLPNVGEVRKGLITSVVKHMEEVHEYFEQGFLSPDSELNAPRVWKHLAALFETEDLTSLVEWKVLFVGINVAEPTVRHRQLVNCNFHVLHDQMTCCRWFFVWTIRGAVARKKVTDEDERDLKQKYNEYMAKFVPLVKNGSLQVLSGLCDLHLQIWKELSPSFRKNDDFKKLLLVVKDGSSEWDVLWTCFERKIICEDEMDPQTRRDWITKYLQLALGVTFPDMSHLLYRYYESHHNKFGDVLNEFVAELNKTDDHFGAKVVARTIWEYFEHLMTVHEPFDVKSVKARPLTKLIDKFLTGNGKLLHSAAQIYACVMLLLQYVRKCDPSFKMFYFVKRLAKKLDQQRKKSVYDAVLKMVPQERRTELAVAALVKAMNVRGRR